MDMIANLAQGYNPPDINQRILLFFTEKNNKLELHTSVSQIFHGLELYSFYLGYIFTSLAVSNPRRQRSSKKWDSTVCTKTKN